MKYLLLLLFAFTTQSIFSQQLPDFSNIPLSQASEYKAAEPAVLQAAGYVLSTAFIKDDRTRLTCYTFIMKWITGTPDYSFDIDASITKTFKDESDLLVLYMAAMAKYALENPAAAKDQKTVDVNAMSSVLNYCNNPANNLKMTKPMKKLWEAKEEGKLAEALN